MENIKLIETKNGVIYYNGISLLDLAKEFQTPLKVTFLDVIKGRVELLKDSFDRAIKEKGYSGKFISLNANKANYGYKEVETALKAGDGLETSSYYDLLFSIKVFENNPNEIDKYLVLNGYKLSDYIDKFVEVSSKKKNVIDIIDSLDEYEKLKKHDKVLNVGLRIHIPSLYSEGEEAENDRFGLCDDEFNYIISDIKNTKLILSTIHFHQRGFDYVQEKFEENFLKVFTNYYVKASRIYDSVVNFDMGGGTPLPVDGVFDYYEWAKYVIGLLQTKSKEYGVREPNLISENGKYNQKDSTVNIYKVVSKKNTDKYPWHVVNGSLLIALPEMYALGEPIAIRPINELNNEFIKGRLAGVTCDCDDVYFNGEGYVLLPNTDSDLYISCLGTGSYQNSMNGKRGVHHCMLPEERDLVIETIDNKITKTVRNNLQTIEDIMKLV